DARRSPRRAAVRIVCSSSRIVPGEVLTFSFAMLPVERELAALKFIDGLSAHLKDVREPQKALRHALRDTREFFGATHGCIATLAPGRSTANLLFTLPKRGDWDLGVLTRYIRYARPPVAQHILIRSLSRRRGTPAA